MTPETVNLVQSSWAQVAPIAPQAAAIFYDELFQREPSVKSLFKGDMVKQGEKLMQMIGVAVSRLTQLSVLVPALESLGKRHVAYGVTNGHYATVGAALLATLEKGLGPAFTPDVRAAWTAVYGVMAQVMTEAAAKEAGVAA